MHHKTTALLLAAAALAGCSSASGPTFTAHSVGRPNEAETFQVECYGLLEGPPACQSKAREICRDQPVRPLEDLVPLGTTRGGERNIRVLRFQCGAAAAPS